MGSSYRAHIVDASTIVAPAQRFHCEIVNLNTTTAPATLRKNQNSRVEAVVVSSGRKQLPHQPRSEVTGHGKSVVHPPHLSALSPKKNPSTEIDANNNSSSNSNSHNKSPKCTSSSSSSSSSSGQKKKKLTTNDKKEEDRRESRKRNWLPSILVGRKSKTPNNRQIEEEEKKKSFVVCDANDKHDPANEAANEVNQRNGCRRLNSSSLSSSSIHTNRVTVHRVHFNTDIVSIVDLDDSNSGVHVKTEQNNNNDNDTQQSSDSDSEAHNSTTFARRHRRRQSRQNNLVSAATDLLWSSGSNKFTSAIRRRLFRPKESQIATTSPAKGRHRVVAMASSYVLEKRAMPSPTMTNSSPTICKIRPKESKPSQLAFGFNSRVSSFGTTAAANASAEQQQQQSELDIEKPPALPPKGVSRLPTFFSKLAHSSAKVNPLSSSSGIPPVAPKLLGSKSIGNVSQVAEHNSQSDVRRGQNNERRSSFVSTNSCDNISTASNNSHSRIGATKKAITTAAAAATKKAQSSHNVSLSSSSAGIGSNSTARTNGENLPRFGAKSVNNLAESKISSTTRKSLPASTSVSRLPTSSSKNNNNSTSTGRQSLPGARSKMEIGGRITETITDRSTVGIPIRPQQTNGNGNSLQASSARFQQHQSQIYTQRMNFFGFSAPPTQQQQQQPQQQQNQPQQQQHSVPVNSNGYGGVSSTSRGVECSFSRQAPRSAAAAAATTQVKPFNGVGSAERSTQVIHTAQAHQQSTQNGATTTMAGLDRCSPHKSYNPYNRPITIPHMALPPPAPQPQRQTPHLPQQKVSNISDYNSANYVRNTVNRYQSHVLSGPQHPQAAPSSKFGFASHTPKPLGVYQTVSSSGSTLQQFPIVQQSSTPVENANYTTFTKKTSATAQQQQQQLYHHQQQQRQQLQQHQMSPLRPMDKRDEMSFVAAMVSDCQMRRQQQQQQQQQENVKGIEIARANVALADADDTDVEEDEEMRRIEKAPTSVATSIKATTVDYSRPSTVKSRRVAGGECGDGGGEVEELSLASATSSASSSSSSSFRHVEHVARSECDSSQQQDSHPQQQPHQHINSNPLRTSSSTHSALSLHSTTSNSSSFCYEQSPPSLLNGALKNSASASIVRSLNHHNQQHHHHHRHHRQHSPSTSEVSPASSVNASPSFVKVRTASSATTVSQDSSNKDLFFDDEIADQPDLMIMNATSNTHNNNNGEDCHHHHHHSSHQTTEQLMDNCSKAMNRSAMRLNLARSLDYSSGSSSTTTTMAQEASAATSPLTTPTNQPTASIRSANTELESLMHQISLTDHDFSSLTHCPQSPARKNFHPHREVDRSRSFSFQNATGSPSNGATTTESVSSPRVSSLKKRHSYTSSSCGHVFRKPRPLSFVENEDGTVAFDSPSMRAIAHDMIGVKTLLFRLQGILQTAETQSPFESRLRSVSHPTDFTNSMSLSSRSSLDSTGDSLAESRSDTETIQMLRDENLELRQHIQALELESLERERTVRLLQQQMGKYTTGLEQEAELHR